ncbi:MAG: alanine:cation symporter family protein [Paludibacteraceae bacterium]|nr:alanine:cation symporter family protein [Paludibacteraceae bacterium]
MDFLNTINEPLALVLLAFLLGSGVWFSFRTRFIQIRMIPHMFSLLSHKEKKSVADGRISPVKAFLLSLGARVGTGNLAGVATAIALGGPGAVFWMWVMALLGGANAFLENTLGQLYKESRMGIFVGGPAYYISKGMKKKWFAFIFAVAIMVDFGFMNNMVQSNTITAACCEAFGWDSIVVSLVMMGLTLAVLLGGLRRIARVSGIMVPLMAIGYVVLTLVILVINWRALPHCFALIVSEAFHWHAGVGGLAGSAIIMGFKRGLFSNEAGLGSSPNVAATAVTKHPVTQGLIQTVGIYTDTIVICTCTALIIMCSGLYDSGLNGVNLTQSAMQTHVGAMGTYVVAVLIFFFAFSSVIANTYSAETNVRWMAEQLHSRHIGLVLTTFRCLVAVCMLIGGCMSIDLAWGLVDFAQSVMAICNLVALCFLGKYAIRCLDDYLTQLRAGIKYPEYHKETIPEIADDTTCW